MNELYRLMVKEAKRPAPVKGVDTWSARGHANAYLPTNAAPAPPQRTLAARPEHIPMPQAPAQGSVAQAVLPPARAPHTPQSGTPLRMGTVPDWASGMSPQQLLHTPPAQPKAQPPAKPAAAPAQPAAPAEPAAAPAQPAAPAKPAPQAQDAPPAKPAAQPAQQAQVAAPAQGAPAQAAPAQGRYTMGTPKSDVYTLGPTPPAQAAAPAQPAAQPAAPAQPAPQAQTPAQPAPQVPAPAAPQAPAEAPEAPSRTLIQHADAAMTHMRGAPARNMAQFSPENQQTLRNAGATAAKWGRRAATFGALGAGAMVAKRVLDDGTGSEQDARMRDYLASTQHQMQAPMPGMSVYGSYEEYGVRKHAQIEEMEKRAWGEDMSRYPYSNSAQNAMAGEFGKTLAQKLVSEPIDLAHRFLKRKLIDDPKANAVFHTVIAEDPMLREEYERNPVALERSFATIRKMSPTTATLHGPVQSFLRNTTITGGAMDMAALKQLAEIQRFHQNAKGVGT